MTSATEAIEAALDVVIEEAEPVSGGDNARGYRLRLDDGRKLFCKTMAKAPPFMMTTEAASLRWLRAADAVRIPEVVAVSDGDEEAGEPNFLVLEWMDPGRIIARTDPELGRALAALH